MSNRYIFSFFQDVVLSRWFYFYAVALGVAISLPHALEVLQALFWFVVLLSTGLVIVWRHPASQKWLIETAVFTGTWLSGQIATSINENTESVDKFQLQCAKFVKIFREGVEVLKGTPNKSSTSVTIFNSELTIPFTLENKEYELVVAYDRKRARVLDRPYLLNNTTNVRRNFPKHHPCIPFYLRDLYPQDEFGWDED